MTTEICAATFGTLEAKLGPSTALIALSVFGCFRRRAHQSFCRNSGVEFITTATRDREHRKRSICTEPPQKLEPRNE